MAKIKSEFLKNLSKLKKMRNLDVSDFDGLKISLEKGISGFFPVNKAECDALLLLSSYPLIERQGVFKVTNSLLYLCKNKHPSINELFDSMGLYDADRDHFLSLMDKYSLDILDYYNLFRNEKFHDDLSAFNLSTVRDFCFSVAEKSKAGTVVSHPVKMTDPACKQPRVFFDGSGDKDGFVRTGNVEVGFDLHINATQLVVFKFLSLPYKGKTLWECIKNKEVSVLSEIFSLREKEANDLIEIFSVCLEPNTVQSGSRVRQVYFPMLEGYHLLSILNPSGLVFSLKNKVDWINHNSPESYLGRKAKNDGEIYRSGYQQLFNLTVTRHGGDHPKNISGLNNKYQSYYLLQSLPPELSPRNTRLPTRNFFGDVLYPKQLQETFQAFHRLISADHNNINIRKGLDYRIEEYLDHMILKMWQVRKGFTEQTHSRPEALPTYQKLWLLPEYAQDRLANQAWANELIREAARHFNASYKKVLGRSAMELGDDLYQRVTLIIEQSKEALL